MTARARFSSALFALLCLSSAGCSVLRPSNLPSGDGWLVAVKSCRVPDGEAAISHFAHHSWIDVREGDEDHWLRLEVLSESSGVRQYAISSAVAHTDRRFGEREVRVLDQVEGQEARRIAEDLRRVSQEFSARYAEGYQAWPGPNSNTYLSDVAARIDGLSFGLHHNAVGKDYTPWLRAGLTTSRTGVRVDTLPLGFALGLREGVEVHFLQLTFGFALWPPRLELPFLPEIPWARDVPEPDIPMPEVHRWMTLVEGHGVTDTTRLGAVSPDDSLLIEVADVESWAHVSFTAVRDGENGPITGLRVVVRALNDGKAGDTMRLVDLTGGKARLWEGDLASLHVVVDIERAEQEALTLIVESSDGR